MNLASGYVVDNVLFNQTSTSVVKSDSDPQILITVAFNMPVKIKHFVIRGGSDKAARPKTLKLFKNKTTASFDECENDEPTQTFTLKDSDYTDKTEVKYVKFQAVTSLAVHNDWIFIFIDLFKKRYSLKITMEPIQQSLVS